VTEPELVAPVRTDPFELVLTCVIGCVGFVYERAEHRLTIRHVFRDSGGRLQVVGRDRPSDLSTARARACRARKLAARPHVTG